MLLQANGTLTICGELKFADIKSKSYKLHLFEINEGKLICYKDKSVSIYNEKFCVICCICIFTLKLHCNKLKKN